MGGRRCKWLTLTATPKFRPVRWILALHLRMILSRLSSPNCPSGSSTPLMGPLCCPNKAAGSLLDVSPVLQPRQFTVHSATRCARGAVNTRQWRRSSRVLLTQPMAISSRGSVKWSWQLKCARLISWPTGIMAALFSWAANPQTTARVSGQHCGGTIQTGGAVAERGGLASSRRPVSRPDLPFRRQPCRCNIGIAHPHARRIALLALKSVPGWEVLTRRSNEQNCVVYPRFVLSGVGGATIMTITSRSSTAECAAALVVSRGRSSESQHCWVSLGEPVTRKSGRSR